MKNLKASELRAKIVSESNVKVHDTASSNSGDSTEEEGESTEEEYDVSTEEENNIHATESFSTSPTAASTVIHERPVAPSAAISKLNFKLLNILANMRIFVGNVKNGEIDNVIIPDDGDCEEFNVKDYLIDGFISFIEILNGF